MKKALLVFLMITLVIGSLAGCGKQPTTQDKQEGDELNSYTFKLGFNTTEDSVRGEMSKEFKRVLEEESNGRLKVEIFPTELLGSEQEQIEGILVGSQDFSLPGGGAMSNVDPVFGAASLPFLTTGYDDAHAKMDGEIGDYWKQTALKHGYKILGFGDLGFAQVTNSKRAINSIEDMRGLKMRSPNEPVLIGTMQNLGASVATIPFTEVYLSLQQGVVDGQFNPMDAIYQTKFHEVQDYMAQLNIFYYNINFLTSEKLWNQLDDEAKEIVQKAADAAIEVSREYYVNGDVEYLKKLQDSFKEVTEPDTTEFRKAVQPVYDEFAKKIPADFAELLNK
ncbi:tripartite ATP-independent transporter solute receptor, DctP family [Anaerovirgula multivorans]|uniref:Tripartite ATP-independent transporter solute receptor, DctP family n=1 Tax=Anaerovirgula multivorans TaxID=312168 RepID=A0A239IBL1_9FIRM|nr:TRAP transporter substrate-binding protein [Anaerovirgula multivorans]SNS91010.1 tripartite ATP-independent transporter solute receptor, DctP family [Anaerovirgula multivorans]